MSTVNKASSTNLHFIDHTSSPCCSIYIIFGIKWKNNESFWLHLLWVWTHTTHLVHSHHLILKYYKFISYIELAIFYHILLTLGALLLHGHLIGCHLWMRHIETMADFDIFYKCDLYPPNLKSIRWIGENRQPAGEEGDKSRGRRCRSTVISNGNSISSKFRLELGFLAIWIKLANYTSPLVMYRANYHFSTVTKSDSNFLDVDIKIFIFGLDLSSMCVRSV